MKPSKTEKIALWIAFVIFALYAISLLYPIVWLLLNAMRKASAFDRQPFGFNGWYPQNFIDALSMSVGTTNLVGMFVNSIILVVGCTFVAIFVPAITGYVVAKFEFPGRKLLYGVAISSMLIPAIGTLTATFKLVVALGLYNTHIGIIIMSSGGFGFNFVMVYGFFKSISKTYAEAAQLDGASDFTVFIKVMIPQVMPSLIAIGIVSAINYWNDYFTPYMYLRQYPTVAVGLQQLVDINTYQPNWPRLFAAMLISIIPPVAVFIAFQKTIMENTVAGGLKG
ncbi:MAG: carbohydrate ABC transporter permease [Clostridia bacterium]|nr:carbohydrate ABC transporter permease [Clostridia bacterium]